MKKFVFVTLVLFFIVCMKTFSNDRQETLFGGDSVTWGGFGAPEFKLSEVNGEFALYLGGRGGVIINNSFIIGLAGYGVVTSHELENYHISGYADSSAYLRVGYGGLYLGYTINPHKVVHITTGLIIGGGGALYTRAYAHHEDDYESRNKQKFTYESSPFMVIEPSIGAELNITKFMRFEVGASYKIISYVELPVTKNSDISGLSGYITFKFGKF
ncbi:MAG: hypothetical protein M9949_01495 [Candidatus Kapabacteria bacterium]|nr:hypothetical protein [Candidatus Kapabacteria bacterium]